MTDDEDIILDQRCADCAGPIMVSLHGDWRQIVQHVDAETEAEHSVRHLTLT
jgi:hypothetical protein